MPRLGGYRKKREFVRENNPRFLEQEHTREDITAEYHRLNLSSHSKPMVAVEPVPERLKITANTGVINQEAGNNDKLAATQAGSGHAGYNGDIQGNLGPCKTSDPQEWADGSEQQRDTLITLTLGGAHNIKGYAHGEPVAERAAPFDNFDVWDNTGTAITGPGGNDWGEPAAPGSTNKWGGGWSDEVPEPTVAPENELPSDGKGHWTTIRRKPRADKGSSASTGDGCFRCKILLC